MSRTAWRDGVEGGLFEYDANARLVGANEQGALQFEGDIPDTIHDFLPLDHLDQKALTALLEITK